MRKDDPICVMARDNGKIVVTETWIDDTVDFGARADETKVLNSYWYSNSTILITVVGMIVLIE